MSVKSTVNPMDNYNESEDMKHLLTNLDSVSSDELDLFKRSLHNCLNNSIIINIL